MMAAYAGHHANRSVSGMWMDTVTYAESKISSILEESTHLNKNIMKF